MCQEPGHGTTTLWRSSETQIGCWHAKLAFKCSMGAVLACFNPRWLYQQRAPDHKMEPPAAKHVPKRTPPCPAFRIVPWEGELGASAAFEAMETRRQGGFRASYSPLPVKQMARWRLLVYPGVVLADVADPSLRRACLIPTWALLLAAALPGLEMSPCLISC